MAQSETHRFEPGDGIPNSVLPLIVWKDALPHEARNGEAASALFARNGWGGNWVWGVYDFWHFHTRGHEVLGCVSGTARIGFGGEGGIAVDIEPGDAVIIPAGVGHKCLEASGDFRVAGGYPPGQEGNIVRPGDVEIEAAEAAISALALPEKDPVTGSAERMMRWWSRSS